MRHLCYIFALFMTAISGIVGCDDSGQDSILVTNDETIECKASESVALSPTETTDFGTPQDTIAPLNGKQTMPLDWWVYEDGDISQLSSILSFYIAAKVETARIVSYDDADTNCKTHLAIDAAITFDSQDGVFRELFNATIAKSDPNSDYVEIEGTLAFDEFQGIYNFNYLKGKYKNPVLKLVATAKPNIKGKLLVTEKRETTSTVPTLIAEYQKVGALR